MVSKKTATKAATPKADHLYSVQVVPVGTKYKWQIMYYEAALQSNVLVREGKSAFNFPRICLDAGLAVLHDDILCPVQMAFS